jgi:hypothetical protein
MLDKRQVAVPSRKSLWHARPLIQAWLKTCHCEQTQSTLRRVADLMFSLRLWIAMGVHSRWYLPDLGACDVMAFNSQPTTPGATQGSLVATRLNTSPFVQGANPR